MHLACKIVCGRSYSGFNFKSFGIAWDCWLLVIASYNVAVMQITLQKKTYLLPISRDVAWVATTTIHAFGTTTLRTICRRGFVFSGSYYVWLSSNIVVVKSFAYPYVV